MVDMMMRRKGLGWVRSKMMTGNAVRELHE